MSKVNTFKLTKQETSKLLNLIKNDDSLYFLINTQIELEREQKRLELEFKEISDKLYSGELSILMQDNLKKSENKVLTSIINIINQRKKFQKRTNE